MTPELVIVVEPATESAAKPARSSLACHLPPPPHAQVFFPGLRAALSRRSDVTRCLLSPNGDRRVCVLIFVPQAWLKEAGRREWVHVGDVES